MSPGTGRVTRSLPKIVRYLRSEQPDVLITRQVHANFVGLAASWLARVPRRWHGKLVLVQDHPVELYTRATGGITSGWPSWATGSPTGSSRLRRSG